MTAGDTIGSFFRHHRWSWGGWLLMTLVMIVFWAAVITAVVLPCVIWLTHATPAAAPPPGPARAEDLLAERFARGEIDDDEYRQRLTLLRDQR